MGGFIYANDNNNVTINILNITNDGYHRDFPISKSYIYSGGFMHMQKFNQIIINYLKVSNLYSGLDGIFHASFKNYIIIT